ncbi:MAG: long-chain fatty acid--CoA ligase [Balneolaceae bacterium]|nr:long-chain fatty acid--CoA ligase [Balneolaceae bacterium]
MENRIVAENMAQLFKRAAEQYGDLPAFATRIEELQWEPVSFREMYNRGLNLATGLIELGVEANEHVGLFGDNRFEWILTDCGIQLCGAADVPRGRDITDTELVYIINHAEIKIAFAETRQLAERILSLKPELPTLKTIILHEEADLYDDNLLHISTVESTGKNLRADGDRRAEQRMEAINPDDLFTLIYTSGTTGKPKGVMLSHANIMSQMKVIPIELSCTDRVLSILPVWHIFERVFEVYTISCGVCTYYTSIRTLGDDLKNVEPTFMGSAPRLWESLHHRILKKVKESHPMRQLLFHTAYFLSKQYKSSLYFLFDKRLKIERQSMLKRILLSPFYALRWVVVTPFYGFFNVAVLEPVRLSAGGSLKATVSGGGALPNEIDRFFNFIGIPVLEGYGMTETSPVIAVRTDRELVIGTVGPVVADTDVRIVDIESGKTLFPDENHPENGRGLRGEIHVKGPQVMQGYYKEKELTEKTIQNGWLNTGDLGMITFNNCLKILGRTKSTIVLLSGENLEPEPIEMRLTQSPLIEHCMIVGQDKKHIGALIVPDLDGLRGKGIEVANLNDAVVNNEAKKLIRAEIKKTISLYNGFKRHELIQDFTLLPENFRNGVELTSLYKMKRHIIQDKYADEIESMFKHESTGVK